MTERPTATLRPAEVHHALAWFAVAVIVGMQAGTIFRLLGSVGETRVADWIDLITPFAIVGSAALVLQHLDTAKRHWILFGVGALSFTLGHGLHLSANSISNADDIALKEADIVHLWDEVVSHRIWYPGLFVVLVALALALRSEMLRLRLAAVLLTAAFTVTLVNTYIEGGVPWLGLGAFISAVGAGLMWRPRPVAVPLLIIGGLGVALLGGWGIAWFVVDGSVFPEFSDVGWI